MASVELPVNAAPFERVWAWACAEGLLAPVDLQMADPAGALIAGLRRARETAFAEGQAHATATAESRAAAWTAYRQRRASYEAWLRDAPAESFAPATFAEIMALYDENNRPGFPEPEVKPAAAGAARHLGTTKGN